VDLGYIKLGVERRTEFRGIEIFREFASNAEQGLWMRSEMRRTSVVAFWVVVLSGLLLYIWDSGDPEEFFIRPFFFEGGGHFAFSLAAGDLNGDSVDDLIISSPVEGNLYVILGPMSCEKIVSLRDYDMLIIARRFKSIGLSVTNDNMLIRDVNNDNKNDLIVTTSEFIFIININDFINKKESADRRIVDIEEIASVMLYGGDQYGLASSMDIARIDSDDLPDLLIGFPLSHDDRGVLCLLSGSRISEFLDGGVRKGKLEDVIFSLVEGELESDFFGWGVAAAKLNSDRYSDVVVSARRGITQNTLRTGKVHVIYGNRPIEKICDFDITIEGISDGDFVGRVLDIADIDLDGLDDILIGSSHARCNYGEKSAVEREKRLDVRGKNCGEVYLVTGRTLERDEKVIGLGDSEVILFYGHDPRDRFGWLVITGDFNNDRRADIVIGAKYADGRDNSLKEAGELYLIDNNDLQPQDTRDLGFEYSKVIYGTEAHGHLGLSGTSGDMNGDGFDDLIVGSITEHEGLGKVGKVNIYYGGYDFFR
jgi:hypothetical protein